MQQGKGLGTPHESQEKGGATNSTPQLVQPRFAGCGLTFPDPLLLSIEARDGVVPSDAQAVPIEYRSTSRLVAPRSILARMRTRGYHNRVVADDASVVTQIASVVKRTH